MRRTPNDRGNVGSAAHSRLTEFLPGNSHGTPEGLRWECRHFDSFQQREGERSLRSAPQAACAGDAKAALAFIEILFEHRNSSISSRVQRSVNQRRRFDHGPCGYVVYGCQSVESGKQISDWRRFC